ncbi:MAG: hypothetical protein A2Y12_19050 [Planctomycetes bacterium GWF2_42_9]|nr:MAG: hypothetical protein A2Y12_19050 [Planctomycetes bacterium GWF2_42_9]HAL45376.1 hypothetical protein [Phycisphaerales bacterium]
MKARIQIAAFYILIIILGGCVPSLHPLFTENELVFDANLIGKWSEPNSSEYWQFSAAANNKYDVIYKDEQGIGKFDGLLGKIGNETFLDLFPKDINLPGNDFYKAHLLGAHIFLKINLQSNGLSLLAMNPENMDKLLTQDPNAIKNEKANGRTVLTASTKELQYFIRRYSNDPNANIYGKFEETKLLKKVQ